MRPVPQQPPILDRSRFSLFAVRHNDGSAGSTSVVAHRPHLDCERKTGPSATEESTGLDLAEQFVSSGKWLVATESPVCGEIFAAQTDLLAEQPGREAG